MVLEVALFKAYYYSYWTFNHPHDLALKRLKAIAEKGRKENYLHIEARALRVIGEFYWRRVGNYELATEYYLRLGRLLDKTNATDFPNMAEYYYLIGELYYFLRIMILQKLICKKLCPLLLLILIGRRYGRQIIPWVYVTDN